MDKKVLFVIALSVGTLFIFNYFSKNNQKQGTDTTYIPTNIQSGQAYRVPSIQDLAKPINLEVDFVDKKITQKEELQTFNTDFYVISFSNYGGVISDIEFKKHEGKEEVSLKTISHKSFYEREESAFLLALDEKTPYFYNYLGAKVFDDQIEIIYQTNSDNWIIKKIYTIYKNTYKINLKIAIENKNKEIETIHPRLFYPAPFIGEVEKEFQNGIVINTKGESVDKISDNNLDQVWIMPSIFGAQDKYFVHTLISDNDHFVQRGFFKKVDNKLFTVLDGPEIENSESFNLSFYIGPKLLDDLLSIDKRLESLLDFGWLSWLCKLLLKLLEYLYSLLGNFGVAIVVMTILLKIPFVPLSISGRKKMEEYQKHMPALTNIRMKYKNDPQKLNAEIMRFHKERGLSPTAQLSGCLPLLIQMPILFALYRVLNNYLGLYKAPFIGWITDLSTKDPYYILPVVMGLSMFVQQKLNPTKDDKQKVMMMFMPILLTAMFINFPTGLVLYWLMNNLLTIGEDLLRKKFLK